MYEDLKIAYYQMDIVWDNKQQNFSDIEREMAEHKDDEVDLLILPEVFTTGFKSKNIADFAEPELGETYQWMQKMAIQYNMVVMGSMFVKNSKGSLHNTLYMVYPDGNYGIYQKRHLFRLSAEHAELTKGTYNVVFPVKGWRIAPYICYDLRFPAWMRNDFVYPSKFRYDVCVVVANWPTRRVDVWKKLLEARAIENMSYVVGVNRIGPDADGVQHSGESRVINYKGNVIDSIAPNESKMAIITLNYREMRHFREVMPFYMDWDDIAVKNGEYL